MINRLFRYLNVGNDTRPARTDDEPIGGEQPIAAKTIYLTTDMAETIRIRHDGTEYTIADGDDGPHLVEVDPGN